MQVKHYKLADCPKLLVVILFILCSAQAWAQTLPYHVVNNSPYPDSEVYIGIVGITDGHVWVNPVTGQVNPMSPADNTVPGPVYGGNQGPGNNGLYANCFRKLSDISNNTINIPKIAGCRIMIAFESQLYLYFFGHSGAPSGYSAPNLENPTDPNQGIKYELIELTYNDFGLWCNTTRVDSYQYPMGLEVWGNNFYKKVGEQKTHAQILSDWQSSAPTEFQGLIDSSEGIIQFPTKNSSFPSNFFQGYIDAIWSKYSGQQLVFNSGQAGVWRGSVQGNQFVFTRDSDGQVATIPGKPNTVEAMEGSGVLASGGQWDLVVQAQFVAAITRHAIDLNVPSGVLQDFGNTANYYQTWPYNWYAKFFHREDISFEGQTYAFAYDDVFDQSATVHTPNPTNITITLGGFESDGGGGGSEFSQQIEAEDYGSMQGVQLENCSEGGQNVGYIEATDWMAYNSISIPESGTYLVEYRVASESGGGQLSLDVNAGANVLGTLSIPSTGGWQNWTTVSHTVYINAGTYNFGIYAQAGGWNINWWKITKQSSASAARAATAKSTADDISIEENVLYPNPAESSIQLRLTQDYQNATYSIIDKTGKVIINNKPYLGEEINISDLPSDLYLIKVQQGDRQIIKKFIKK
ncbi:beta-1,3-glucanase family protein [Fulvivirga maritima]|uniref:beta-1,3-glucanase family protein n=1 Tax=Fulvivirga maritima TaxID=2904247 RepID=UPI001F487F42|nr:beta-1,3-glucanase family protein [Fulvivirga maritima]UII26411.1 beta-1,3-glucanase family protein [Fulvivirga maritima]